MKPLKNWKISFLGMFIALFGLLSGLLIFDEAVASSNEIKVDKIHIENFSTPEQGAHLLSSKKESHALSISEEEVDKVFISPTLTTKHFFNALGIKAQIKKPADTKIKFYLNVENHGWRELELIESNQQTLNNDEYEIYSEAPYTADGQNFKYKIVLERSDKSIVSPEIKKLEIFYLDTTQKSLLTKAYAIYHNLNNTASKGRIKNKIITREEWGANEDWRFWEPEYAVPKKIIIHHTASGTGGDDPSATIRAIYFWHAQIMGWGDIGYNYLVDAQGNVYEGRYGGEGVIGAHTYNEVTRTNYNPGTIGIAILGCYEDEKSGCSTVNTFSPSLKDKLTDFLAYLAKKYNIKPKGKSALAGKRTYNIIGHRHLDYTLCPGNIIYKNLASIRRQTSRKYKSTQKKYFAGRLTKHNLDKNYLPKEESEVKVIYTNTGTRIWRRDKAYLKIYNNSGKRPTKFRHKSWQDSLGKFRFNKDTVAPGEAAVFTFKIKAPAETNKYKLKFKVFINKSVIKQSRKTIKVEVVETIKE